jgi:hypothetical protein
MREKRRLSTPPSPPPMVTALPPTMLIILALIVAMFATDGREGVIALSVAAMLAAAFLLRWRLLRRLAPRDQATAIQHTASPAATNAVDRSWPVNRPRSPVADDVRERVS